MSKSWGQKLKIMYIHKILFQKTDENHPMTTADLIAELERYGVSAERKSIYSDIEALQSFGVDVHKNGKGVYIDKRDFELAELMVLADVIASSKFVTTRKSAELIDKIASLTSERNAAKIRRQIYVSNRAKSHNERIYENVDKIHQAISENRQIRFKYYEYGLDKQQKYRRNGEFYTASPCGLCWDDENYYMFAFYERYGKISHFRVDRMEQIEITVRARLGGELIEEFNASEYYRKLFSMVGGELEFVRLRFDNSLINVVLDRFGTDLFIRKHDAKRFAINLDLVVSSAFLGWLFQFGNLVEVVEPDSLRKRMAEHAEHVVGLYKTIDR